MKYAALLFFVFALFGCQSSDPSPETLALDQQNIETTIRNLYVSIKKAYTYGGMNTDSLLDVYYDPSSYYVTPWATSEIIDSTKSRFRSAHSHITEFDYSIESFSAKSYGNGGIAFFILRQDYKVDGQERSEYLPTTFVLEKHGETWKIVHAHRSADPETWAQWFSKKP
ncbi:MAG TPA: nuclear transport factor 2 family protein [Bacteroidota bacterium]|nr:nuclear transport factor 2 family protein [Bacteroidota bacterium]